MLTQLTVRNFGLIDELSVDFNEKLNILTGETGAGKSIVIGALRIALGGRIQQYQMREVKDPCSVEAVFDLSNTEVCAMSIMKEFMTDEDNTLIIHRTYHPEGRKKIKVNGFNVTLTQLKNIGKYLMDFHGPHDHQLLLSSDSHIGMLDRLIDFGDLLQSYEMVYKEYLDLKKQIEELEGLSVSRERELDMLSYQVKELEQVSFDEEAYQDLLQQQTKINNTEKLNESVGELLQFLDNDAQGCVSENIRQSFSPMRDLNAIDEKTNAFLVQLDDLQNINDSLVSDLRSYAQGLSYHQHEAENINARCDMIDDMKRKYGPSLPEVEKFYLQAKKKYDLLINLEHSDKELRDALEKKTKQLSSISSDITKLRKKVSKKLKTTIEKELSELGIAHVQFEVRVEKSEFQHNGADLVTFYISPNVGMEVKPLSDIVSSGEAARVMLALKRALIEVDPIPVLIFDEIDAQIGGRLGSITGKKLRDISNYRQVLLITHLPQIASFAHFHFKVDKTVKKGKAVTTVKLLNERQRIQEIAEMMSGKDESNISIKHAQDMLVNAGQS